MAGEQPTGTVTHLFTDIQGSTKLWERQPEGMQAALNRHDALLRAAIAAHGGHLVKTTGDGFHAVFDVASDALAAAIAAQRALQTEPWSDVAIRVRMGLHSGAAQEREGDYFGPALNRAARLMAAGHGGQILLTGATRELVRDRLPAGVELLDIGKCLFKGLSRPEQIFQVVSPGLPTGFPPLRMPGYRPHNLPTQATPFVGRERELAELSALLASRDVRLVTILGVGGMGKTRLALELGINTLYAAHLANFSDGVFFVPLAPLESADSIVPTVAQAIGLSFQDRPDPQKQLLDYLSERQMLLILDNFEHLLDGVGWVIALLPAAPEVKILSTSRTRLNIQGEQILHLSGMDFPDGEAPADSLAYSAVRLFMQSARRVRPGFEPVGEEQNQILRICRLVGGMPLGILLAAAWVEMLTPGEIASEMAESLGFLQTDLRNVPERQRSLRAVLDYSWNLLSEREQEVFGGLSVFRGGFTLQAAQAVTSATLRELMHLVTKSLLHRAPAGSFEVHDLLRQYAAEKLLESGEADAIHQRHLETYSSMAELLREEGGGGRQVEWMHHVAAEIDNMRAALDWCLRSGNAQAGLRLALCLRSFWGVFGYLDERRDWFTRLLEEAPEPTLERAHGLEALGQTLYNQGEYTAAQSVCEESLALSETLGDRLAIANATFALAWPVFALGDCDRSHRLLERSLAHYQDLGRHERVAFVILVMGEVARAQGGLSRALALHEQSVTLHRRLTGSTLLPTALSNLGCVLIHAGELERSQRLFEESLSIELEMGGDIVCQLMGFALLANARGQPFRATRLLGASDALRIAKGAHVDVGDRPDYERTLFSLRHQLDQAAFEAAWAEGQALTLERAVALALSDEPL